MRPTPLLVLGFLVVNFYPSSAEVMPRSGSACSKVGITKIYKSTKYVCIKSGKKLIWNKGVPVVKKTSVKPASAVPTPSTTSAPSPSPTTVQISGSPEQLKSYENMKKAMAPKPVKNLFRFHYSPRALESFKNYLELELNYSMTYWASIYDNPELFNVFYGTESDMEWLIDAWRPYGFDKNTGFADDFRGRIAREGNRLNAGAVPSQSNASHLSILRHTSLPPEINSFVPHENVHIVQQYVSKNRTGTMPCWLREGSANLFGNFIFAEKNGLDLYNRVKQGDLNNYKWGSSGVELRNFTEAEWFTHLKSLEGNFQGGCNYINRFAYGSGLLLCESLMADGGFDKMMDFWRSFGSDKDWRDSFRDIYGTNIDTWYKETAIPYVMREYKRVGP
jgi:hypothetical protein